MQRAQNRAARTVTKLDWSTPVADLLKQCGWLSVRQLVLYHSLILVFKVKMQGKPEYFKEHFSAEFAYPTRLATGGGVRRGVGSKHEVTLASFVPRSSIAWNNLGTFVRLLSDGMDLVT